MKATLIKKAEGWYNLYQDKIGIGSTHEELQGYKLSKQNCDEIFGIFDVENLAEYYVQEVKESNADFYFRDIYKEFFIEGFNKAMELNKDKQFTLEDIHEAIRKAKIYDEIPNHEGIIVRFNYSKDEIIESITQPTEIEVEIEMKAISEGLDEKAQPQHTMIAKLDKDGCLILKKEEK